MSPAAINTDAGDTRFLDPSAFPLGRNRAQKIGTDETLAEVLPEDKARQSVQRLQTDVGIAMGTGAKESAGVTLIKGDLRGRHRARRCAVTRHDA